MSRIYKFRAWDGLRMTTSGIMFNTSTGCVEVPTQLTGRFEAMPEDKQWKLMEFTGLCDKNGKEIYEGDIIRYTRYKWEHPTHPSNGTDLITYCEVYYSNEEHAFYQRGKFVGGGGFFGGLSFKDDRCSKSEIAVIGNIYQNPEMLNLKS